MAERRCPRSRYAHHQEAGAAGHEGGRQRPDFLAVLWNSMPAYWQEGCHRSSSHRRILATGLLFTRAMVWLSMPLFVLALTSSAPVDHDAAKKQTATESAPKREHKEKRAPSDDAELRHARTKAPKSKLTKEGRLAFIRRAQVWTHTDIPSMDLRAGPPGAWRVSA